MVEEHAEKGGQKKREHAEPVQQKRGGGNAVTVRKKPSPGPNLIHSLCLYIPDTYAVMGSFPFWAVLKEH
jgi:hypothetical protein